MTKRRTSEPSLRQVEQRAAKLAAELHLKLNAAIARVELAEKANTDHVVHLGQMAQRIELLVTERDVAIKARGAAEQRSRDAEAEDKGLAEAVRDLKGRIAFLSEENARLRGYIECSRDEAIIRELGPADDAPRISRRMVPEQPVYRPDNGSNIGYSGHSRQMEWWNR